MKNEFRPKSQDDRVCRAYPRKIFALFFSKRYFGYAATAKKGGRNSFDMIAGSAPSNKQQFYSTAETIPTNSRARLPRQGRNLTPKRSGHGFHNIAGQAPWKNQQSYSKAETVSTKSRAWLARKTSTFIQKRKRFDTITGSAPSKKPAILLKSGIGFDRKKRRKKRCEKRCEKLQERCEKRCKKRHEKRHEKPQNRRQNRRGKRHEKRREKRREKRYGKRPEKVF